MDRGTKRKKDEVKEILNTREMTEEYKTERIEE